MVTGFTIDVGGYNVRKSLHPAQEGYGGLTSHGDCYCISGVGAYCRVMRDIAVDHDCVIEIMFA